LENCSVKRADAVFQCRVVLTFRFYQSTCATASRGSLHRSRIIELVRTRIPRRFGFDPIRDIQVLCPMNRDGVGARSLNIELQAALNPAGDRKVERFELS
jgi:ATP-dependent exoDNAse (exonuclease V) alpha subunit